jgi:hypothetical protein
MTNRHLELLGWLFFTVSAIGYVVSSIGNFWAMFGSVFFLVACLVFLVVHFRKDVSAPLD